MAVENPKPDYLEPAYSIILELGGPSEAAKAAGVSRSQVWRWCQPRPKGTGGTIPRRRLDRIKQYVTENKIPRLHQLISA